MNRRQFATKSYSLRVQNRESTIQNLLFPKFYPLKNPCVVDLPQLIATQPRRVRLCRKESDVKRRFTEEQIIGFLKEADVEGHTVLSF
jgi:hypothetical protein